MGAPIKEIFCNTSVTLAASVNVTVVLLIQSAMTELILIVRVSR
jgi:hypothetical protein